MEFNIEEIKTTIVTMVLEYGPKLILAIFTLIFGLWAIKIVTKTFVKGLRKSNMDESLVPFLNSLLSNILKVMLIVSVAGMVGIETTSFVAVLGAAGLAVGLALQGSLGNFAGGVLILIFKPFKIGDFIKAQGHDGTVKEIQIFCTILKTADNRTIIIPNGPLAGGSIENVSTEATRRVDLTFGIGYSDSIDDAKIAIKEVLASNDKILSEPAPQIFVSEQAASSVNFVVRPWVKAEDYWSVYFYMQEMVKKKFDEKKISIPFPQTDVHVHQVQ